MSVVTAALVGAVAGAVGGVGVMGVRIRRAGSSLRRTGKGTLSARIVEGHFAHMSRHWRGFVATPEGGDLLLARYPYPLRHLRVRHHDVVVDAQVRPKRPGEIWGIGPQTVVHRATVQGGIIEIGMLRREEGEWLARFPAADGHSPAA